MNSIFRKNKSFFLKVKNFVNRIIPDKFKEGELVTEKGRILINDEYLTPDEILKNDPFFKSFRDS